ncbi:MULTISPECIES: anti-sigma F factor antagonist [unclassified Thermoanaerobacterium]|uniref:anti-sigma F factor antagonist n=1 Tax=unclassified Thermoanaerobacterium TaxID=2622527 RepID=UPI000A151E2B|nr:MULTISPECIES: anti-sigma F factor antagonist [unclassified Thermoanaerobacterium]MDE4541720.1 anti-sigma F factor antagonist [Thermoanaerobacterium sp. R66]ORX24129.1 anti-sigma F factor antagonist [Thermoanaerobacterium sp. PSU-2]
MGIKFVEKNDTLIVKIKGELDHHTSDIFKDAINTEYQKGFKNIILDFEKLNFMDSSGIGMILGRYKMAKDNDGKLAIVGANSQLLKVIELSGILRIINCYDTIEEAIKNMQRGI